MPLQYIDGLPCIDGGGEVRKLAALPPPPAMLAQATRFSSFAAPDPSTWKDCDLSEIVSITIRNQGQYGSCTGHAGIAIEDLIRQKMGLEPVLLSCTFPYAHVNGGRDNGASVSSILKVLKEIGTCTHAECGTDQIYKQQIPQSAFKTAEKFKIEEAFLCRSFEEICEAINRGFPVAFGIMIGQNFNRLSAEGVAPLPDVIAGGHALAGVGLKKQRGGWLIKTQNSWGTRWGINGFCYLTRGHFDNMVDAYAIMYANNTNLPPVAKSEIVTGEPEVEEKAVPLDEHLPAKIESVEVITPTEEPVVEQKQIETAPAIVEIQDRLEPVTFRDSMMKQIMAEEDKRFLDAVNAPLPEQDQEEKPVNGTASMTHTDPDALSEDAGKRRKNRHKH